MKKCLSLFHLVFLIAGCELTTKTSEPTKNPIT